MKVIFLILTLLITLLNHHLLSQVKITGNWLGKLKLPDGNELRVVFKLSEESENKYKALLDSPDQGVKDITCEDVLIKNDSIIIKVPLVNGWYEGKIKWDANIIEGKWYQAGQFLKLDLKYSEDYTGIKRPQEPKPPFPYKVEDVIFENEDDGVYLSGTLTYPEEGESFPAVILITGSGPQNRNEEVFGHKPFLVISDFLTRNGFAVLRFDDRGVGASTGDFSKATTFDHANDVLWAIEYLKTRDEIDVDNIGLLGHSEGGMIAQIAAVENPYDVKFIVMLAGVAIPGDELILLQSEKIALSEGRPKSEIDENIKRQKFIIDLLKSDAPNHSIENEIRKFLSETFPDESKLNQQEREEIKKLIDNQIKTVTSDWYRNFLKFNPAVYLEKIKCPVLALNGEKDVQVPPKENLKAIENSLKKADNKNFKVLELKGLNHLFQSSNTGSISEYAMIEETISPVALEEILNWLKEVVE